LGSASAGCFDEPGSGCRGTRVDLACTFGTSTLFEEVPMLRIPAALALLCALASLAPSAARADDPAPFAARAGLDAAVSAARAWAGDAALVYLENDGAVGPDGASGRWGYLFHSPASGSSRFYSVRDGRVVVAEAPDLVIGGPPLTATWLDSRAALAAADAGPGGKFRSEHGGVPNTMLLMRGTFQGDDPDRTTWTLVYRAPRAPALFVVVDAVDGKVRRTWRG
jgi:hypothetical protein